MTKAQAGIGSLPTEEVVRLREENLAHRSTIVELRMQIAELQEAARVRATVKYDRQSSTYLASLHGVENGRFCSRCYDVLGKLVRMHRDGNHPETRCPECKNHT